VGYWLVVVAALLSMLTALRANLFAASRVAVAMARDRTLPTVLESFGPRSGAPVNAILATAVITFAILFAIPDVAAAGAAASLIFLVTFALAHGVSLLARRRTGAPAEFFRTPLFPLVPVLGGSFCLALAAFQAIVVPAAGKIAGIWLGVGAVLFLTLFAPRARVRDAASEAADPHLLRLRGRSPLVLVPIANPAHAAGMVEVANALAAPGVGRVLLLNVVAHADAPWNEDVERSLTSAQAVLREALLASFIAGRAPEALTTVAESVFPEIDRVARVHDCESLLLGLTHLEAHRAGGPMEQLLTRLGRDTVVLRAASQWRLSQVRRILIPVGGRGHHGMLRARLVASLCRGVEREITYLRIVPPGESPERASRLRRVVRRVARDESHGRARVEVARSDEVAQTVTAWASRHDLVIMGLQRPRRRANVFGVLPLKIAAETDCAIIMLGGG
jgi:hypothetical protein